MGRSNDVDPTEDVEVAGEPAALDLCWVDFVAKRGKK
jgi:hypothetical protein